MYIYIYIRIYRLYNYRINRYPDSSFEAAASTHPPCCSPPRLQVILGWDGILQTFDLVVPSGNQAASISMQYVAWPVQNVAISWKICMIIMKNMWSHVCFAVSTPLANIFSTTKWIQIACFSWRVHKSMQERSVHETKGGKWRQLSCQPPVALLVPRKIGPPSPPEAGFRACAQTHLQAAALCKV